jgi:transposase
MSKRAPPANQMRGLLSEFGIILPQGISHLYRQVPDILADGDHALPGPMRALLRRLLTQLRALDQQVAELKGEIVTWHLHNGDSRRLEPIGGFGPLTASALVASLGNARSFKNGRQVAAWLGLVPRQDSSGGTTKLLGISKHDDVSRIGGPRTA